MLKILLILILAYLIFRAGRNLLHAAVRDGLVGRDDWQNGRGPSEVDRRSRRHDPRPEIEDAVWEDLP